MTWVNLIYEIVEEAMILPLFYLLGKSMKSKDELGNKTRTGLLVSVGAYLVLSVIIVVLAKPLCVWMASDSMTIDATVTYIRLESVSLAIGIISKFVTVLFVTLGLEVFAFIEDSNRELFDSIFAKKFPNFSCILGNFLIQFKNKSSLKEDYL